MCPSANKDVLLCTTQMLECNKVDIQNYKFAKFQEHCSFVSIFFINTKKDKNR